MYVWPVDSWAEPHVPSFPVTVCGTLDCAFVQVTVLFTPMTTVMFCGVNEKLSITTFTVDWAKVA